MQARTLCLRETRDAANASTRQRLWHAWRRRLPDAEHPREARHDGFPRSRPRHASRPFARATRKSTSCRRRFIAFPAQSSWRRLSRPASGCSPGIGWWREVGAKAVAGKERGRRRTIVPVHTSAMVNHLIFGGETADPGETTLRRSRARRKGASRATNRTAASTAPEAMYRGQGPMRSRGEPAAGFSRRNM
jgi:hypothetical protein